MKIKTLLSSLLLIGSLVLAAAQTIAVDHTDEEIDDITPGALEALYNKVISIDTLPSKRKETAKELWGLYGTMKDNLIELHAAMYSIDTERYDLSPRYETVVPKLTKLFEDYITLFKSYLHSLIKYSTLPKNTIEPALSARLRLGDMEEDLNKLYHLKFSHIFILNLSLTWKYYNYFHKPPEPTKQELKKQYATALL